MDIVYNQRAITITLHVKTGLNNKDEDFSALRCKAMIALLEGPREKYGYTIDESGRNEHGQVTLEIPAPDEPNGGLLGGVYNLRLIWFKKRGAVTNEQDPGSAAQIMQTCVISRIFGISDTQEDDNTGYDPANDSGYTINFNDIKAEPYGRDGMSAYEIALLHGSTVPTESAWIEKYENAEDRVNYEMNPAKTGSGEPGDDHESWAHKELVRQKNEGQLGGSDPDYNTSRIKMEIDRRNSEGERQQYEGQGDYSDTSVYTNTRRAKEEARQAAESDRNTAERIRQEDEVSRQRYEGQGDYSDPSEYSDTRRAKEAERQTAEGSVVFPEESDDEHPMPTSGSGRLYNEAVRQFNEDVRQAQEGTPEDEASADGSRWARYKHAEDERDTSYGTAEGTSESDNDGSRWAAYKGAEASRDTARETAEGSSSSVAGDGSRWGAYKTAEAARDAAYAAAEAARDEAIAPAIGIYDCSTAAATAAKTVSASDYILANGGAIKIKFQYANSAASPTLNINSQGAKAIVFNGAVASESNTWGAGEVVEFYYDPTYNSNAGAFIGRPTVIPDGVFDISAYHATGGTLATYANLATALGENGQNVPARYRKPNMTIAYVDSSDNNYVQYMCKKSTWSSSHEDWEKVNNVSVSQNAETGHTDINIGNNQFPVPSIDDIQRVLNATNGEIDAFLLNYHRGYYILDGVMTETNGRRSAGFNYIPVVGGSQVDISINSNFLYTIQFYTDADEASFIQGTDYIQDTSIDIPADCRYVRFAFKHVDNEVLPTSIAELNFTLNNNADELYAKKNELELYVKKNVLNGYANIQNGINSKANNKIDLGTIGNYYSPTGEYTLVADNARISTMVPIFIGKGNIVHINLPNGLECAYNTYPNTNPGVARTTYETFTGNKAIVMSDDYLFLTFQYSPLAEISTDVVNAVDSQVYAILERINTTDYYSEEQYSALESLDVTKIRMARGSIDINTGTIFMNTGRLYSEFIPVKPLSRLYVNTPTLEDDSRLDCYVLFYHINADGSFNWLSQYTFDAYESQHYARTQNNIPSFNVIVPPTCNAIRFYLIKSDGIVNYTDVTSQYLSIQCHSRKGFKNITGQYNEIKDSVSINEIESEWIQGVGVYNFVPNSMSRLCNIFKVYPGQRLAIRHNHNNLGYRTNIYLWEDIEQTGQPTQTLSNLSYLSTAVLVIPDNIHYISFAENSNSNNVNITPAIAKEDNWHIFDVTGKPMNLQHAEKILDVTRASSYAQGMAIQNGYVFQAFADGYIDIYDLHTRAFVQTIQWPYTYTLHGNNIQFGDKYDTNDDFGILWVSTDYDDSKIAGFRVQNINNEFTLSLVYEVTPPVVSEAHKQGATQYFDFVAKQMVQFAFKSNPNVIEPNSSGYSDCIISLYSWNGELNNNTAFTFIHTFEFPVLWAVQGGRLYDGVLYLLSGPAMNAINIFNVIDKKAIGIIDMTRNCFGHITEELQGIDYADGPYISFTSSSTHHWGLIKLNL